MVAYAIHAKRRACERRFVPADEVGAAGELDGRTGGAVKHPDGMQGRVSRVNARQRNPMIARDLPGNGRRREQ
jgi:hypothetical protein